MPRRTAEMVGLLIQRLPLDEEEQRLAQQRRLQQAERVNKQQQQQLEQQQQQQQQLEQQQQQQQQQDIERQERTGVAPAQQLVAQLVDAMDEGAVREAEVEQWLRANSGNKFRAAAESSAHNGTQLDFALHLWGRAAQAREVRDLQRMLDKHESGEAPLNGSDWARWGKAMRRAKPDPRKPLWEVMQSGLIAVFSSMLWDGLALGCLGCWLIALPRYLNALHAPLPVPQNLPICCNLSKISSPLVQPHAAPSELKEAYYQSYIASRLAPQYDIQGFMRLLQYFNGAPCFCNYSAPVSTPAPTPAPARRGPTEPTFTRPCGSCPDCGFQSDLCGWSASATTGTANWRWQSNQFDHAEGTGPRATHSGLLADRYVFFDSRSGSRGDEAALTSPLMRFTDGRHRGYLAFGAFQYGRATTALSVQWQIPQNNTGTRALGSGAQDGREIAFDAGQWYELRRLNKLQTGPFLPWVNFSVFLPVTADYFRVRFQTARGYSSESDVALDAVKFTLEASGNASGAMRRAAATTPTPPTTTTPAPPVATAAAAAAAVPTGSGASAASINDEQSAAKLLMLLFQLQATTLALALSSALPMLGAVELPRFCRRRVWEDHVRHADKWGLLWQLALTAAQLKRTTEAPEDVLASKHSLLVYQRAVARARWLQHQDVGRGGWVATSCATAARHYLQARALAAQGRARAWVSRLHGIHWRSALVSTPTWLVISAGLLALFVKDGCVSSSSKVTWLVLLDVALLGLWLPFRILQRQRKTELQQLSSGGVAPALAVPLENSEQYEVAEFGNEASLHAQHRQVQRDASGGRKLYVSQLHVQRSITAKHLLHEATRRKLRPPSQPSAAPRYCRPQRAAPPQPASTEGEADAPQPLPGAATPLAADGKPGDGEKAKVRFLLPRFGVFCRVVLITTLLWGLVLAYAVQTWGRSLVRPAQYDAEAGQAAVAAAARNGGVAPAQHGWITRLDETAGIVRLVAPLPLIVGSPAPAYALAVLLCVEATAILALACAQLGQFVPTFFDKTLTNASGVHMVRIRIQNWSLGILCMLPFLLLEMAAFTALLATAAVLRWEVAAHFFIAGTAIVCPAVFIQQPTRGAWLAAAGAPLWLAVSEFAKLEDSSGQGGGGVTFRSRWCDELSCHFVTKFRQLHAWYICVLLVYAGFRCYMSKIPAHDRPNYAMSEQYHLAPSAAELGMQLQRKAKARQKFGAAAKGVFAFGTRAAKVEPLPMPISTDADAVVAIEPENAGDEALDGNQSDSGHSHSSDKSANDDDLEVEELDDDDGDETGDDDEEEDDDEDDEDDEDEEDDEEDKEE